ncbi:MAG TPA: MFS transporter [Candidatus Baltobacteraceae bacterium]|nr:MFS transporter [Candidatus Baltobacteraceae bacterium]
MRARDIWVLLATIVGSSLAFIDGTVVNLALPQIQRQFHATATGVTWIVELYTLVLGSLMLLGGALADRYGRRVVFDIGVALFGIGSIGCAFSWSIPSMLCFRVVQGVGGTLAAPASLAILGAHFSGAARGRAVALWSAFGALTSTLAPMAGGVLIDALGWRAVFFVNVPLIIIVLYATLRHVEESRDDSAPTHLDVPGAIFTTIGFGAITYALIFASAHGWRNFGAGGVAIGGVLALAAFAIRERVVAQPLIPPEVFASRPFAVINLATLLLYGALGALFYFLPFVLIQTRGYTALQTALATLPMAASLVLLARLGTWLARRFGVATVLTAGPLLVAVGFALLGLFAHRAEYFIGVFPGVAFVGIGMGITVAPLTTAVIGAAGPKHVGIASGINTAIARIAGLLAIAVAILVVTAIYNGTFDAELAAMKPTGVSRAQIDAQRAKLGGATFTNVTLTQASHDAFDAGFAGVAYGCAALALCAGLVNAAGTRGLKSGM